MTPASYYREKRELCRQLNLCMKCAKADAEFPYTCCTRCRGKQTNADKLRAQIRRSALDKSHILPTF